MQDVSVVIVAAGNASRMGSIDKQTALLGGIPVLLHSVRLFAKMEEVAEIIIVTKAGSITEIQNLCAEQAKSKLIQVVSGGNTRQESVYQGVVSCQVNKLVSIHDGARPLLSETDAKKVFADARIHGAATLGVPIKDTIKRADNRLKIVETPTRSNLFSIQTPQVFDKYIYLTAFFDAKKHHLDCTDDCQLIERIGRPVYITIGSYQNIKITTPEDLIIAEALFQEGQK